MNLFLHAISSMHPILKPCLFSITLTNSEASWRESKVPVSSHAVPLSKTPTSSFPFEDKHY
jgi:hypothetical protein